MRINNKKTKGQGLLKPISSGDIVIMVSAASIVVVLIFLFFFNIIKIPDFILNLFNADNDSDVSEKYEYEIIDDIKENNMTDIIYETHNESAYKVLSSLEESESYTRKVRMFFFYGEDTSVTRANITKNGDCFRVETDSRTVIYDGEILYIKEPTYSLTERGSFNIWNEVGTTPLSYIKENANKASVSYKTSVNPKIITAVIRNEEQKMYSEYEISTETGIVITEKSYFNNLLYRVVMTDTIDAFKNFDDEENLFVIPEI